MKSPLYFRRSFEISVAFRRRYSVLQTYSIRIQSHNLLATIALEGEADEPKTAIEQSPDPQLLTLTTEKAVVTLRTGEDNAL